MFPTLTFDFFSNTLELRLLRLGMHQCQLTGYQTVWAPNGLDDQTVWVYKPFGTQTVWSSKPFGKPSFHWVFFKLIYNLVNDR